MKTILTLLILFWFLDSNGQNAVIQTITVNPYLSFQNYEHFKRLTLSSPDSDVEFIEGFEFQWGYSCKIQVEKYVLKPALTDGTRRRYKLNKIVSITKEPDSASFTLLLDADLYHHRVEPDEEGINNTFKKLNDTTFSYFDKVEIEVPARFTEKFQSIANGKRRKRAEFKYINKNRIRLIKL